VQRYTEVEMTWASLRHVLALHNWACTVTPTHTQYFFGHGRVQLYSISPIVLVFLIFLLILLINSCLRESSLGPLLAPTHARRRGSGEVPLGSFGVAVVVVLFATLCPARRTTMHVRTESRTCPPLGPLPRLSRKCRVGSYALPSGPMTCPGPLGGKCQPPRGKFRDIQGEAYWSR
jgi:hypothetical protein